jgi:predicted RNase H-like nuclease (RuvC/YqgF family)
MEDNQSGGNKKIYVAIIALLLLINGVALYLLYSENKAKKDLTEQKNVLQGEFDKLTDTLDVKKAELEQYKGKNAELDSLIIAKQEEIDQQKKTIAGLFAKGKMNSKELAEAKAKIAQYEASIADFQKKVEELTKQNQELTAQNQQLNTDLNAEKQTTNTLTEQNKGLSKKVELGSLLHLQNVQIVGVTGKKNKKGEDITINKGKKTAQLKVSFETGDNKVLEAGNLSLYVRIINPKGETIAVADQGSGSFKSTETGETIQYTKQADFDWSQTNKKVVVYWSSNVSESGTYKVEIYQSGYLIGKGEVTQK